MVRGETLRRKHIGAWGTGNLENDDAADEIYERSCALVTQLWDRIQQQESWEPDEEEHGALFVDFETVFALDAVGLFNRQALREIKDVEGVFGRWLPRWAECYSRMALDEAVLRDRRAVIETTFARFRALWAEVAADEVSPTAS